MSTESQTVVIIICSIAILIILCIALALAWRGKIRKIVGEPKPTKKVIHVDWRPVLPTIQEGSERVSGS